MLYEMSLFWANFKHCFQIKCKTLITFFAVWVDEVTQQQLSFPSFYWLPFIVSAWFTPPWHFTIKKAVLVDLIMLHYQGRKKEKKIVVELSSLVLYSLLVKLGGTVLVSRKSRNDHLCNGKKQESHESRSLKKMHSYLFQPNYFGEIYQTRCRGQKSITCKM